ncbi:polysaccharide biosynthesis/export family protein [Novosphingobium cyanobacteriorum]|uniref:Polysaccharide biosynthesis/export family protein n=1 Tax=Novosphingobium cyanobacteriorum TaxID=3024215 RepID=A0ABT6CDT1_9SPHN|nr:polysaccharide biosynthesis/export family protein [Novosphingobium cyanobacteriorum]MDF8332084.1 polysaccharide biosynthesis/export family protein [Novosphingobium cyanobacteriorum]
MSANTSPDQVAAGPLPRRRPIARIVLSLMPALALAACALPRSGPSAGEFRQAGEANAIQLVTPTLDLAKATREEMPRSFGPEWQDAAPAGPITIGTSDVLSVTIFERDGLNMFPAGPNGGSMIEGLSVDANGAIQLPYIGSVRVAGMVPNEARATIVGRLRRLSLSPDVLVAVTEHRSQMVAVQGDVMRAGMVPLSPGTSRLSALLSTAAPTPANLELATVTVRRGIQSATVRLADIFEEPADDIQLRRGDVVIVRSAPGTVNVLGAAGLQGRVKIARRNYSVLDAVADARGLNDNLANPRAVFVMRLSEVASGVQTTPRVYNFDFSNPAQMAIASVFALRDGDAIMISNNGFAQTHKVLSAFSGVMSTARSAELVIP